MKKTKLLNKISVGLGKASIKIKKHSPEILVAAGVIGTVTSTVIACKATTKVNDILENSKEEIEKVHAVANGELPLTASYTEEDSKKDLTIIYIQTGIKLAKLYAPVAILEALSVISILAANNIMRKRNIALAAAYASVSEGFKAYRKRVVDRFGNKVDRELRYNVETREVEQTITDEDGNEKTVKKTVDIITKDDVPDYARAFKEYLVDRKGVSYRNPNWDPNNDYNLSFIQGCQSCLNDLLRAKKYVFLNEAYKLLGFAETPEGQIAGWIFDEDNPNGDNYIDFGIDYNNPMYLSALDEDGVESQNSIVIDFNVDGYILERI